METPPRWDTMESKRLQVIIVDVEVIVRLLRQRWNQPGKAR